MADLSALLETIQLPEKSWVDMTKRRAKGTPQWFLEKDQATHPIHDHNRLEFFMCGQESFNAIEKDIRKARSSIDLVLWGFDPGMELSRDGNTWPHGKTYGELLVEKARQGVKVRLLIWWNNLVVNRTAGNLPDFPWMWSPVSLSRKTEVSWLDGKPRRSASDNSGVVLQDRHNFCVQWWQDALSGAFENLEIRFRSGASLKAMRNLAAYLPDSRRDLSESVSMIGAPTHHQKPILIDYMQGTGETTTTCGYVMGLNSVTDYWDTAEHKFNDPLRELSPNAYTGWNQRRWHRKPYRDYAVRIQGEALYSLNENFVQGWDNADGMTVGPLKIGSGAGLFGNKLADERKRVRPKDLRDNAQGGSCRVQIQRTQPEQKDGTILKGYTLASANAMSFIYVENQYFQLPEWSKLLRDMRKKYREAMKGAGASPDDMAPLHLFVVIPQAEKAQMVPRTYEAVGGLGAGEQMAYDKDVQGQRKRQEEQDAIPVWERPDEGIVELDSMARASANVVPVNIREQLAALGIKPLVAMLMSYDHINEAREIRIKARDSDAQQAQARQEARANQAAHKNEGQADDVDGENKSHYNITPKRYREIYIHSKLMIVDDVYLTLGSANLNARSMAGDSELNLCTEAYTFTREARRRIWGNLAGDDLKGDWDHMNIRDKVAETHKKWIDRMSLNQSNRAKGLPPTVNMKIPENSFIHPFEDPRGVPWIRLA